MDVDGTSESRRPDDDETNMIDGHNDDEDEDYVKSFIASLPPAQQECVTALEALHTDVETMRSKFRKEQRAVDRKYEQLASPIYKSRAEIISGECKAEGCEEGIPGFWIQVMKQNASIRENITERDEILLKYLTDVSSTTLAEDEGIGFRLEFYFKPNEFFSNAKLTKTYYMEDSDYHDIERAEGTPIDWKEGRNLTVRTIKKRQRKKNSHETRIVVKTEPCESFFNFFSPPVIPQAGEGAPVDPDELDQREDELDADLDLGLGFHEDLVPNAIKWFIGEEGDSSDGEASDGDESGDGEGDDDDDDDDDDDEKDADFTANNKEDGVDIEAFIAALPEPQKKPVSMLLQLDSEAQCLYAAHRREVRALDRKYEQLNAPIFAERARIVAGEVPPSSGGTAGGGIPGFWLEAMKNSRRVRELITERDEPALQHLVDVIATTLPEIPPENPPAALGDGDSKVGSGTWAFQLEFVFQPNEFFSNTRLVKTYWLADTPEVDVVRAEGCAIEWRDGKCLTMRTVRKKRRSRSGRGMRTVLRTERCDSFFHFFSPPQPPQPEDGPDGEVDMDEQERYEEGLEDDGEVRPVSARADGFETLSLRGEAVCCSWHGRLRTAGSLRAGFFLVGSRALSWGESAKLPRIFPRRARAPDCATMRGCRSDQAALWSRSQPGRVQAQRRNRKP
jgi:nucleosome assembly protein 1-like 1